jgi:hypothetical protein
MELPELEAVVMELKDKIDTILNTVDESEKEFQHKKGVEEFTSRNGEALGKYVDKMKKLNGDDFDLYSAAYDEYNNDFSDVEESTYVAQLVSEIDNKIAKLKEALGEDDVEIHSDAEGELEVNSHDTEIEADTKADEPAKDEDSKDEEPKDETEKSEDEDDETSEEEKEFIADLESEYDKYHR